MRPISIAAVSVLALLAACGEPADTSTPAPATVPPPNVDAAAPAAPSAEGLPAGAYTLDKSHASLTFTVSHLGFSNYTASFTDFDAKMTLDPANPSATSLQATVNPASLAIPAPPAGFLAELKGPQWLDVGKFATISFNSTDVETTGPNTAKLTGDLTLHGVTKPVTLDVTFNGGYPGHPMDPNARVGFSAKGVFKRSEFGMGYGVPAPGTTMGVGDEVTVAIETEFTGPPLANAAPAAPAPAAEPAAAAAPAQAPAAEAPAAPPAK